MNKKEKDMVKLLDAVLLGGGGALDEYGLDFCLIGGTLLGIIRDGHQLGHDFDVDVAVLAEDITPEIKKKLEESGHFVGKGSGQDNGGLYVFKIERRSFDIFVLFKKGDKRYFNADSNKCLVWPAYLFDKENWGEIEYLGRKWKIPYKHEEYFEIMYGPKWHITDKTFKWQHSPCFAKLEDI